MRLLLDTHAFVWWAEDDQALSAIAHEAIGNSGNEVFVSAATAWEITTKHRLGKFPAAAGVATDVEFAILDNGFELLAISVAHAQRAGGLKGAHGDPFDRMLSAQSIMENLTLVSSDKKLDQFGVKRLW